MNKLVPNKNPLTQLKVILLDEVSSGQKRRIAWIHTKEHLKANPTPLTTVQNDSESTCDIVLDK